MVAYLNVTWFLRAVLGSVADDEDCFLIISLLFEGIFGIFKSASYCMSTGDCKTSGDSMAIGSLT